MMDIKFIRDHVDLIKENCKNRRAKVDVDQLLAVDEEKRTLLHKLEAMRATRNAVSKGKPSEEDIQKMRELGEEIKSLEEKSSAIDSQLKDILLAIPNLTHPDTPVGGENDYKVVYTNKKPAEFSFEAKNHEELLTERGLLDFERGAKVAGSKFYFLKGNLVRLNQALIQHAMNIATKYGFELIETPDLVKQEILEGSGFNPRGEESQIYSIKDHDLHLIGTAEITVLGYHANEVLDLSEGPKLYAALSHCFRTEGGAYGKESRGLYRVHQFTKLELFAFCKPENGEGLHEKILAIEKDICDDLQLAYRVIDIPSGDLGGPAYRKYDVEAWMPGKGEKGDYGEITSTSNCTDYQARRLNIKYKKEDGSNEYVHTLNGTAVVLSRFPLSIVEQFQMEDGSIAVPPVLIPYMGVDTI